MLGRGSCASKENRDRSKSGWPFRHGKLEQDAVGIVDSMYVTRETCPGLEG